MANRFGIDTSAIKVGDVVWFKSDIEQTSPVLEIKRGGYDGRQRVFIVNRTAGEYGRGRYELYEDDIFGLR